jgi:hypothetical protein
MGYDRARQGRQDTMNYWGNDDMAWTIPQMKGFLKGLPMAMTHAHALVRRRPVATLLSKAMEASPLEGWYLTQGSVIDISLCGGSLDKLIADLFDTSKVDLVSLTIRYGPESVHLNVGAREIQIVGDVKLPALPEGMRIAKLTYLERS